MPAEYAALGKLPAEWKPTDVIAEASLIGGIFGKGGGAEVRSALALEAFEKQFGRSAGRAAWSDFREHNDPEAPTTVAKAFPYETASPFAKTRPGDARSGLGQLRQRRRRTRKRRPRRPGGSSAPAARSCTDTPAPQPIPNDGSIGSQLLRQALAGPPHASNWELVNAQVTRPTGTRSR